MRDETSILCDKIVARMAPILPSEALNSLSKVLVDELFNYDITVKPTALTTLEDADIEVLKRFICMRKLDGLTDKSLKQYFRENTNLLRVINKPLKDIRTNDIKYFLAMKTCSDRTKNNSIRYINAFFKWLYEEGYIEENPCKRVHIIKTEKKMKKSLTAEEIEKLKNAADNPRDKALITFMYSTGCRVGEVIGLDRDAIRNGECIVYGKGRKERTVFLNEVATMYLEKYLMQRTDNNPALFVSNRNPHNRLGISGIEKIVRGIGAKAGVDCHCHMLRRTLATNLSNKNCNVQDIQSILGHSNINTTMIYVNVNKEKVKSSHKLFA